MTQVNVTDSTVRVIASPGITQAQLDAVQAAAVLKSLVTAKGDLIAATGSGVPARLAVGADGSFLIADAASSAGVKWAGGSQTFLPASTGTDDTTAIQAILTAGGNIAGKRGESYLISAPLLLPNNTTLDMRGCTITLNAGSNCRMVQSSTTATVGRNNDIHIIGGHWDRGANNGATGTDRHSIVLRKVDRCSVRDASFASTNGKFAVLFQNVTEFLAENLWMRSVSSDGVHVEGPAARGTIRSIRGTCGDDMVALTPLDWSNGYVWGDESDITDILIEDVKALNTSQALVAVYGGLGLNCRRVTVRGLSGSTTGTSVVTLGDNAGNANTVGGLIDEISVDDVRAISTANAGAVIRITASLGKKIALSNLTWNAGVATSQHCVVCSGTSIDSVTVAGLHVISACANNGSGVAVVLGGVVGEIAVSGVTGTWDNASGSAVVYVVGTVNDVVVTNVTGTSAALQTIVKLDDSTAGAIARRVAISNVVMTTLGSSLLRAILNGHTVASINIANAIVNAVSWVVDTGATTKVSLANVTVPTGVFNVRAGGAVTCFADSSCDLPATNTVAGTLVAPGLAAKRFATLAYSASITPAAWAGDWQRITVTNATAFAINAPTSPPSGALTQELTIEVRNSAGGAMGVITWNAAFVFAGAVWTNPASTFKRFARFEWNGAQWICTGVSSADY